MNAVNANANPPFGDPPTSAPGWGTRVTDFPPMTFFGMDKGMRISVLYTGGNKQQQQYGGYTEWNAAAPRLLPYSPRGRGAGR